MKLVKKHGVTPMRGVLVFALAISALTLHPASNASAAIYTGCPDAGVSRVYGAWTYQLPYWYRTWRGWCSYDEAANARLVWQSDGNLVAYEGAHYGSRVLWASNTYGRGFELRFQEDGNVVIYDRQWIPLWSSSRTAGVFSNATSARLEYQFGISIYKNYTREMFVVATSPVSGSFSYRWVWTLPPKS